MRVLYFHTLKKAAGCAEEEIAEPVADVASLLALVMERHPDLRPHAPTILVARNHEWVERSAPLAAGDEVALMPPVSGG
jgi:molybdopterin converting factor subunit 1